MQRLVAHCHREGDRYYLFVSSPTMKDKPVSLSPSSSRFVNCHDAIRLPSSSVRCVLVWLRCKCDRGVSRMPITCRIADCHSIRDAPYSSAAFRDPFVPACPFEILSLTIVSHLVLSILLSLNSLTFPFSPFTFSRVGRRSRLAVWRRVLRGHRHGSRAQIPQGRRARVILESAIVHLGHYRTLRAHPSCGSRETGIVHSRGYRNCRLPFENGIAAVIEDCRWRSNRM